MSKCYRSELTGAFGNPIDENPTGVIMEAGYKAAGLDYRYLTIKVEPDGLKQAIAGIRAMNFKGINLTIPFKVEVLNYLDELTPAAEIIGAVNTVVSRDGRLIGENTDGKGLLKSFTDAGISVSGKQVTVLGAGGASRAICTECALAGASRVIIINKNPQRGQELADLIAERTLAEAAYLPWTEAVSIPEGTDILINATSIGLYPNISDRPDIQYDTIHENMVVSDVIFNDPRTLFLKEAKDRGAVCINGLGMLVNQAAANFEIWTGEKAPVDIMTEVLQEEFGL